MKRSNAEEWEKNHINNLTLKMIFAATIGTGVATAIAFLLKKAGVATVNPELLFIPWGIALVYGVSIAFHQGVLAERGRLDKTEEK